MATLWNLLLVVSLLVLSAPQRCSGVNHGSLKLQDTKNLSELEMVNNALKFTSENTKEGLRLQEKNCEELVDALSQENAELKTQLENKDKMVRVVEKRIAELKIKEEHLEETVLQLNNTVAAQKNYTCTTLECMPHKQEIIQLVQQYSNTKDWQSLNRGLETVLDHSNELYIQLQRVGYTSIYPLYNVGYYNTTQLVSLLLDAGLPVDTADAGGSTVMHGAASGGHLQLVKLLLDRGASVDVRESSDYTPLMRATDRGRLEVVQLLVSAGADTTARNTYWETALIIAKQHRDSAVVQYLEQFPH